MKLDPINFILKPNIKEENNVYFISGNERSLIDKIKDLLIKKITKDNVFEVQNINSMSSTNQNSGLFSEKKLYVMNDITGLNKDNLNFFKKDENIIIFISENSPKTNLVKKNFLNQKDVLIIDCYELNKESKIKILNDFLNKNNLIIGDDLYWELLNLLDNKYMLLEKELEKIREIDPKKITYKTLKKIISNNQGVDDKIFFKLLDSNQAIIGAYNSKITNQTDANKLYFMIKKFTNLIISFENENDFEKNIPRYLFREKKLLVSIFNKFNLKKKRKLINLIFDTDIVMRKNSGLSIVVGLRFLLNLKKIIIS